MSVAVTATPLVSVSIGGVAKNGKTAKDTRTSAQKAALTKLLMGLLDEFPKIKKILGPQPICP